MKINDLLNKFEINSIPYNQPWEGKTLLQHLLDNFALCTVNNISKVVDKYNQINASKEDFSIVGSNDGQTLVHRLITHNLVRHRAGLDGESIKAVLKRLTFYINIKNTNQETPLQYLMNGACLDAVHQNLYIFDGTSFPPNMDCTSKFATEDALTLVKMGADANLPNRNGMPLLHSLITCREQIAQHNLIALETLSAYQVDFNSLNSQGETPLHCLLNKKSYQFSEVRLLVALGANPYAWDKNGYTGLHRMANDFVDNPNGAPEAFSQWVEHCTLYIDCLDKNNLTPLQLMMNNPKGLLTKDALMLVELGANPSLKNNSGLPLIHFLIQYHSTFIKDHNLAAIKHLCNLNSELINEQDSAGRTPLTCLLDRDNFNLREISLLIELGASPNDTNSAGQPWLHALCLNTHLSEKDKKNISKLLSEKQGNITEVNASGRAVLDELFAAPQHLNLDTVSFLMCQCNARFNSIVPPIDRLFTMNNICHQQLAMFNILKHWYSHSELPCNQTIEALLREIKAPEQEEFLITTYCKFLFSRSEYDKTKLSWLSSKVGFTHKDKFRDIALGYLIKAARENPNSARNLLESALDDIVFQTHGSIGTFFSSLKVRGASGPIKKINKMLQNIPLNRSTQAFSAIGNNDL